jgi:putative FmdB family regulatory protein
MPIYDYVCEACGHRLEVMHGVYSQGPTKCPACGSRRIRKAIAAPTVVFKGSGWAKKDRRTAARKAAKPDAGSDSSDAAAKASTDAKEGGGTAPVTPKDSSSSTSSAPPPGD